MRRVVVGTFLTLDGVYQAPGGVEEDTSGGFDHGGWQMPYFDDVAGGTILEAMSSSDGFLLGRKTYEIFAASWPSAPEENPFGSLMNGLTKYVFSTTLQEPLEWNNSKLLKGDIGEEVTRLKEQPGKDLQVVGSGQLAHTLMRLGLVDEYHLMVHPVVLGSGKRLFKEGTMPSPLKLVDTKTTGTGVLLLTYHPAETAEEPAT